MQKPIVWVSFFSPECKQNTLHHTPENVIPLLCYVVTQSWEAHGWGECVCIHTHKHTLWHTQAHRRAHRHTVFYLFFLCPKQQLGRIMWSADKLWQSSARVHCGQCAYRSICWAHTTHTHNARTATQTGPQFSFCYLSAPQISKTSAHYLNMARSYPMQLRCELGICSNQFPSSASNEIRLERTVVANQEPKQYLPWPLLTCWINRKKYSGLEVNLL